MIIHNTVEYWFLLDPQLDILERRLSVRFFIWKNILRILAKSGNSQVDFKNWFSGF